MGKYLLKRLLYLIFVAFIISIILFCIFKLVPGDPASMMLEGGKMSMTPEAYARAYQQARETLGLDKNIVVQYFSWIWKMLTGDFGYSTVYRQPVWQVAKTPLMQTVKLNLVVLFFVFVISVPLGIITAVRKGKIIDNVVQTVTILGHSLPTFIFAILLIFLFSVKIQIFPFNGSATPNFEGTELEMFLDRAKHMVLPVTVLTFISISSVTRYVRASMIDALRMDYIRTARAKGLKEKVVIYSHAFRNSLIPLVTMLVGWFIGIFSGSIVTESIFLWNGMGRLMLTSLYALDFSVALAFNMLYMVLALVGNLIMDLLYLAVDPRVKLT